MPKVAVINCSGLPSLLALVIARKSLHDWRNVMSLIHPHRVRTNEIKRRERTLIRFTAGSNHSWDVKTPCRKVHLVVLFAPILVGFVEGSAGLVSTRIHRSIDNTCPESEGNGPVRSSKRRPSNSLTSASILGQKIIKIKT
jgi:hypothetical protein